MHFQEWYLSCTEGSFCNSDYEYLFHPHIEKATLLHHTVGRYTVSHVRMSESCLDMYFLLSDTGTLQ